jgi:ABC-type amino acid transport substrate-binding protein
MKWQAGIHHAGLWASSIALFFLVCPGPAAGSDLKEIKKSGVLYHLGVPYANFVTGSGEGLDVDFVKLFATHLGVRYEYVKTSSESEIGDLTGRAVKPAGDDVRITGDAPIRGDLVANGLRVLPWREKIVDYSVPTFPTQVWLMARLDSSLQPIQPSGDVNRDIAAVISLLKGRSVLGKPGTGLDPALYGLAEAGAKVQLFDGNLDELVPAVINGAAEATLLDVPDALTALEKWPGRIKLIGPVSPVRNIAFAFAKGSDELRDEFNRFFDQSLKDGTYPRLVKKYYPLVFTYFPDFFKGGSP